MFVPAPQRVGKEIRREIFVSTVGVLILLGSQLNALSFEGYGLANAFGTVSFTQPVCLRSPPGETNRIFVLEKTGLIQVLTNIGAVSPAKSVYMDLQSNLSTSEEQGLLGIAFHPQFQSNGYFYIYRSYLTGGGVYERLSRFQANPPSAPTALTNTEVVLFDQQDPRDNHNGGDLHFGNDGYLYISVGDGGERNRSGRIIRERTSANRELTQLTKTHTIKEGAESTSCQVAASWSAPRRASSR